MFRKLEVWKMLEPLAFIFYQFGSISMGRGENLDDRISQDLQGGIICYSLGERLRLETYNLGDKDMLFHLFILD